MFLLIASIFFKYLSILPTYATSQGDCTLTSKERELFECVAYIMAGDALTIKRLLLEDKVSINIRNREGSTPLHYISASFPDTPIISQAELEEILMYFKMSQPNLEIQNTLHGETPLFLACVRENLFIIQKFLEWSANPNIVNYLGLTPIEHISLRILNSEPEENNDQRFLILKLLLQHGANIFFRVNPLSPNQHVSLWHIASYKYRKALLEKAPSTDVRLRVYYALLPSLKPDFFYIFTRQFFAHPLPLLKRPPA